MSVILVSSDGLRETIPIEIVKFSKTIRDMLNDIDISCDHEIPLSEVKGDTLSKIVEWCKYQHDKMDQSNVNQNEITPWENDFCNIKQEQLFNIILAANYLNIKKLVKLACKVVANMIMGKTPDEIRKTFNIKNDFTPEEEEEIRKENAWISSF
jgi:S-phase kinase-associated protein 1